MPRKIPTIEKVESGLMEAGGIAGGLAPGPAKTVYHSLGKIDIVARRVGSGPLNKLQGKVRQGINSLISGNKKTVKDVKDKRQGRVPSNRGVILNTWMLIEKDTNTTFVAQFPPEDWGLQWEVSSSYGEISSLNSTHPITQFLKGNLETISFTGMMISEDTVDPFQELQKLQNMVRRAERLKHPPVCEFSYAGVIDMEVEVRKIGTTRMLPQPDGSIRHIVFSVELAKHVEGQRFKEPPVKYRFDVWKCHTVKRGDTFESISKQYYGTPKYASALRKLNPKLEPLKFNPNKEQKVCLPRPEWLVANEPKDSHIFKKTRSTKALRKKKAKLSKVYPGIQGSELPTIWGDTIPGVDKDAFYFPR